MHRIDNSTASVSLPTPAAVGPVPNGYFRQRQGGVHGTVVSADWLNAVQEEICYVITQAGITLSKTTRTQLKDAIDVMIENGSTGELTGTLDVLGYSIVSSTGNIKFEATNLDLSDVESITIPDTFKWKSDESFSNYNILTLENDKVEIDIDGSSVLTIDEDGLYIGGFGGTIIDAILDEDDFASNSDTALATQSSTKAYFDSILNKAQISFIGFTDTAMVAGDTKYFSLGAAQSSAPGGSPTTLAFCFIMPNDGTVLGLNVSQDAAPGTSESYTYTAYKNGSSTALTTTVSGTSIEGSDLAHSFSVVTGDAICVRLTLSAGAASLSRANGSFIFRPDL